MGSNIVILIALIFFSVVTVSGAIFQILLQFRKGKIKDKIKNLDIDCYEATQKLNKIIETTREYEQRYEIIKENVTSLDKRQIELEEHNKYLIKNNEDIERQACEKMKYAASNYIDVLEQELKRTEKDFDEKTNELQENFNKQETYYKDKISVLKQEEEKEKKIIDTVIAARLREQEMEEKTSFYSIDISETALSDIKILESIKPQLQSPRILSMLIWTTFFKKPMTDLCNRVLKTTNTVCGIYKITNKTNGKCYIGQSVDVDKRLKEHAKCGLGIDTPASNKLYKEMQKIGIWNFSWELLEECKSSELNEREKYYIDFYKSKDYGYNSSIGISK